MSAPKPDPLSHFEHVHLRLEGLMRHLLRSSFFPAGAGVESVWTPAVDVYETASAYVILVELAGVDRERLEVTLVGDRLTFSGERLEPRAAESKQRLHQMEIEYGRFERAVVLPEAPEPDSVQAHYENGFLRIQVSRRPEGRAVPVRAPRPEE